MLEQLELFSSLSAAELQEIGRIAKRVDYKRGEYIFQQGDISRDLFAIESGQIEVSVKSVLNETRVLTTLKNGELFGEMALFDPNSKRSANARATQNSSLIQIPGLEFEKLLKEKPGISFKLLGTLSRRLKDSNSVSVNAQPVAKAAGKVMLVASPRNGTGKTTFAMTAAHILSRETSSRVLYLDLDLQFADGSSFLGLCSVRTIVEFAAAIKQEFATFGDLKTHLTQIDNQLYSFVTAEVSIT